MSQPDIDHVSDQHIDDLWYAVLEWRLPNPCYRSGSIALNCGEGDRVQYVSSRGQLCHGLTDRHLRLDTVRPARSLASFY